MTSKNKSGITIVVCCFNSADRIGKTLSNLAKQEFYPGLFWEVIIVDNNSTDYTAEIALATWKGLDPGVDLRVVYEPAPGLGNARRKGIIESSTSFLLFCDDDNWLTENYVKGMYDILESDTNIAACGGMGVPVFETEEPYWFYEYAEAFALGSQGITTEGGQVLNLYGAGLAVRKQALEDLYRCGFQQVLHDRIGKELNSSGDTELTYAMVLYGYKLAYSDDLKFFHYLPKERLTFGYLKGLYTAFGADGPVRNLYYSYISNRLFHRLIKNWNLHLALSLFRICKYFIIPPKKYGRAVYFHWSVAYIRELFAIRKEYQGLKKRISGLKDPFNYRSANPISNKADLFLDTPRTL